MSKYSRIYENGVEKHELVFRNVTFDYSMLPSELGTKADKACFECQLAQTFKDLSEEVLEPIFDGITCGTDAEEILESLEELDSFE